MESRNRLPPKSREQARSVLQTSSVRGRTQSRRHSWRIRAGSAGLRMACGRTRKAGPRSNATLSEPFLHRKHLVQQVSQLGVGGETAMMRDAKQKTALKSTQMLEPTETTAYAETPG